ncbi:hypothetical protein B0A53_06186 [Rhodotorula sp. CCFEE 5036]|nr:hypothetical protein B0A53_06186 [Rhodotorula sp. CCFEE 5036]
MADHERTPLLPTASSSSHDSASSSSSGSVLPASSSSSTPRAARPQLRAPINSSADLILTEDDIAIQGMVLALLAELSDRGYVLPPGLPVLPPDMPQDEADAEIAFLRTVFTVPRHRTALDRHLPDLTRAAAAIAVTGGGGANGSASGTETPPVGAGSILSTNRPAATNGRKGGGGYGSNLPARPSPLSSQTIDTTVLTSPSALFLASLLSLLVSLQREYHGSVEETDPGVDGELRMFKARRELGERLYAVVAALLDSYLLTGDARTHIPGTYDDDDDETDDALVSLLFHDFPLNYDSMDRGTSSLDLLLTLSSAPLVEAEDLISHPVVLASTEYVWRNGLLPPPKAGTRVLTWKEAFIQLDRFSIPRILQSQTYILSTLHAAITVYILMFSAYSHFDAFNPLAPDLVTIPERSGSRPVKTWSVLTEVVWWLWIAGSFGWAGEVGRIWTQCGPQSSLPLSPSTLLPLLHHSLVFVSLSLRMLAFYLKTPHHRPTFLIASSLSLLAWSVPFLAASRVLPQNLPSFGTPTHQRWTKIRDGRKRRDVGYRAPPKKVPESHRALRSLEAHLGGLVQFSTYFAVFGLLTLWTFSGDVDYPRALVALLHAPLEPLQQWFTLRDSVSSSIAATASGRRSSPLEARTSLAFTLILGLVLAYFAGGRPSVSQKPLTSFHPTAPRRELDDLDGWDRYGREVAFRARRERLAVNRYFTFLPPVGRRARLGGRRLESLASAFSTPPLPSPLNLAIPPLLFVSSIAKRVIRFRLEQRRRWSDARGRLVDEEGDNVLPPGQEAERRVRILRETVRLWIWRIGISPLGGWAIAAKGIRRLRGKE